MSGPGSQQFPARTTGREPAPVEIALAGLALFAAAMGIGRFAYTPLLPPMREALGWSLAAAGDVATANFTGYLAGGLLAYATIQHRSRAAWFLAGMLGVAATTVAGAVSSSFPTWLALRFVAGVASAQCVVIGTAVVLDYVAVRGRSDLAALPFMGVGAGIVLSVLVIEATRGAGGDVFAQWAVLGGVATLLFLPAGRRLFAVTGSAPARATRAERAAHRSSLAGRELRRLVAAYGLFGFGYIVTATFIVAMVRRLEHAVLLEPLCWVVVGAAVIPSVPLGLRLARRHGTWPVLRAAYLLEAIGVVLAALGSGAAPVLAGAALLGATFPTITALGLQAARDLAGVQSDRAIGVMTVAFGLGQLLGPSVAGRLAEASGDFALPSLIAAVLLSAGAALLPRAARVDDA